MAKETLDGPDSLEPPSLRKLTPAAPRKPSQHPKPPSPRFPALTGPLGPWPELLHLTGSPTLTIDLRNGDTDRGLDRPLSELDVAVLRVMAQRNGRPAHRWLLYELVFDGKGDPSRVGEAVADLIGSLGAFGHHIEAAGPDAWQLWSGPD